MNLKDMWRKKVNGAVLNYLQAIQLGHSKTKHIKYEKLQIQPYIKSPSFNNKLVSLLFNFRSSMFKGIKNNFTSMNRGDLNCPMLCSENPPLDTQSHILECSTLQRKLNSEEIMAATKSEYTHLYGSVEEQREITLILARFLYILEKVLEERDGSLPVGNTGPVIST